jgi:carbohydrate-selective porin OprB
MVEMRDGERPTARAIAARLAPLRNMASALAFRSRRISARRFAVMRWAVVRLMTLTGDWDGLRTRLLQDGVTVDVQEQSEAWGDMIGSLRQGVV